MRDGAEYLTAPAGAAQRRYEALRAYFTEEMPAAEAADRFGYSTASIHQMATLLRKGRLTLFTDTRPGPKGPRKATGTLRARALELQAAGHSVTEIAAALTAEGMPVSAQTVWQILDAEGIPRLSRRDEGRRGPSACLDPVKAAALPGWPAGPLSLPCDHAGLLLLLPAITQIGLPDLISRAGYPSTRELSSWQSVGTLLLAKCARKPRISHAGTLADDAGLAFTLGLTALPKATHLGIYSWRVRREANQKLLTGLVTALRPLGLATGEAGFNCDFHAIRHHGDQAVLEKHYVPRRSPHPRRAHLLRPGPRLGGHGVLQRRHHQGRAGSRDHRLRRLLAAGHRQRSRPAGLRLPADHLQDPRPAHRPRHHLAHPAPARHDRARPASGAARLSLEDRRHHPVRPVPAAPPGRRHDQT